jgi:hypothetical protein
MTICVLHVKGAYQIKVKSCLKLTISSIDLTTNTTFFLFLYTRPKPKYLCNSVNISNYSIDGDGVKLKTSIGIIENTLRKTEGELILRKFVLLKNTLQNYHLI